MDRRAWTIALVLLVAQATAAVVGAYVYAWYDNALEGSGRWVASKAHLGRPVMGAVTFAQSRHTLSSERLDLGRWFGFQEVLLREPVAAREVALDFRPVQGAYLAFLYALGPGGCSGLRLSTDERFPTGRFTADAAGEFLDFAPLPGLAPVAGAWAHLELDFGSEGVMAALEGGTPQRIGPAAPGLQRLGFRSGLRSVQVDDVRVRCDGSGGFHETFFNASAFRRGLLVLPAVLALELVAWRVVRRRRVAEGKRSAHWIGAGASLLAAASMAFVVQRAWAGRYPGLDRGQEEAWQKEEVRARTRAILQRAREEDSSEHTNVFVVGSSQTWGAGATRKEEGLVEVLEGLLRSADPERNWACINAGVSGLDAPRLLQLLQSFRKQLLALRADVMLVNLSTNDTDPEAFAQALHGFAALAEENGIALLFALEANSIEQWPGELPMHATMRQVGEAHGIPVVDVHRALAGQFARGFLWWDFVHPTSLGHRLIAETLLPAVRARLESP